MTRLLDLFCCAGGAAMGYHQAGFEVVGVDIKAQKNYPFEFHQADWLEFFQAHHHEFDLFHASPPCQAYSVARSLSRSKAPKLIGQVREAFKATRKPYIIENVYGARQDMENPITLRGNMFGLQVKRDRLFEVNPWLIAPPVTPIDGSCDSNRGANRLSTGGGYITVAGNCFIAKEARQAMRIDWMVRKELAQAIPPAYTEWIGEQLMGLCFSAASVAPRRNK